MFSKQELPKVFPKDTHKEILLLLPTIARTIAVGRGDTPRNLQAERSTARLLLRLGINNPVIDNYRYLLLICQHQYHYLSISVVNILAY